MHVRKRSLAFLFVVAILLGLTIRIVYAERETFTVPPFREITRSLHLNNGDKVSGSISVVGGAGNDINFFVIDPNGNTILRYERATRTSFSFTASMTGTYVFHFDNSFSIISSKSVTLSYRVSWGIFGIPQDIFLISVGVIIIVAIIAVVVGKRRKTSQKQF